MDRQPVTHVFAISRGETVVRVMLAIMSCLLGEVGLAQDVAAQEAARPVVSAPLVPTDSAFTIGRLPNGVTYYIRRNPLPAKSVELRLAVRAGSLLEDDDQRGLAHVVEHMAFNGTRHFSGEDLLDFLQRAGISVGPDVNATTMWDATTYQLRIPTDSATFLATGIQILEDWAHAVTFDSVAMERQRQRVLDEWEHHQWTFPGGADLLRPLLYADSRYTHRMSSGTKESLESFTRDQVRRFYRDWYRPEFMAVIVVGDVNVKAVERLIRKHFARIPRRNDLRPRPQYTLALADTVRVVVATEPKLVAPRVSVSWLRAREQTGPATVAEYRSGMLVQAYVDMLNDRLADAVNGTDVSFRGASVIVAPFVLPDKAGYLDEPRSSAPTATEGPYVPVINHFTLGVEVSDSGIARGLTGALAEVMRAAREGFDTKAWEQTRRASLRKLEEIFSKRDETESTYFVGRSLNHFILGAPIVSPAQTYTLRKAILESATLEDVNRAGRAWLDAKDRLIVVTVPDRAGVVVPSKDSLIALLKQASGSVRPTSTNDDVCAQLTAIVTKLAKERHPQSKTGDEVQLTLTAEDFPENLQSHLGRLQECLAQSGFQR